MTLPTAFTLTQKPVWTRKRCPRCGGNVYYDAWNEAFQCLQCARAWAKRKFEMALVQAELVTANRQRAAERKRWVA